MKFIKMSIQIERPNNLLFYTCAFFFFHSVLELSSASDTLTPTLPLNDGDTLISANQTFELGFFSPGNSKFRFLGIWYKNIPRTVVWVANINNPVTDPHGVLTFSNDGNLVILNLTKSSIWSSNVSWAPENPVAQILDSGNFVLRGNDSMSSDDYRWQSFDYPTDTLLPGMRLVWSLKTGRERYLTSWKSANDPSPGHFTCGLESVHGLVTLVLNSGSRKLYRLGAADGHTLAGFPTDGMPFKVIIKSDKNELAYTYQPVLDTQTMRLALNQSGLLQSLIWDGRKWYVLFSEPYAPCDNYGWCGANSICRDRKTPSCECLDSFIPESTKKFGTQNQSWSKVCTRELPLDCSSARRDRFRKLTNIYVPDMLDVWLNDDMNLTECEAKCLMNCSCAAYTNSKLTEGGTGCLMWFGDLIDLKESGDGYRGQDIYLRQRTPASRSDRKKILKTGLVVSIISSMLILGLVFCIMWKKSSKRGMKGKKFDLEVPLFDFATISAATNNFSDTNVLGVGGFGPVYKGNLLTGQEIAVKRLSKNSKQGVEEFKNEINLIGQLQHRNLVGLLGCCIQKEEQMLIYEYMTNKSLNYLIFDPERKSLLAWPKRFDIVKGIARGLLYLHQDSKLQIIHRDLKAGNVLLDSQLNPKISDFGLARIFGGNQNKTRTKRVVGTYGYMSPEYAIEGIFSVKSDVFSFGVLLLEIVSSKRNRGFRNPDHYHNLLGHAWLLWNEERALELMDTCLEESCVKSQVYRVIHISLLCVQKFPEDRPTMSSVVMMLANEEIALPNPKEPGFFTERKYTDEGSSLRRERSDTEMKLTVTTLEGR